MKWKEYSAEEFGEIESYESRLSKLLLKLDYRECSSEDFHIENRNIVINSILNEE